MGVDASSHCPFPLTITQPGSRICRPHLGISRQSAPHPRLSLHCSFPNRCVHSFTLCPGVASCSHTQATPTRRHPYPPPCTAQLSAPFPSIAVAPSLTFMLNQLRQVQQHKMDRTLRSMGAATDIPSNSQAPNQIGACLTPNHLNKSIAFAMIHHFHSSVRTAAMFVNPAPCGLSSLCARVRACVCDAQSFQPKK